LKLNKTFSLAAHKLSSYAAVVSVLLSAFSEAGIVADRTDAAVCIGAVDAEAVAAVSIDSGAELIEVAEATGSDDGNRVETGDVETGDGVVETGSATLAFEQPAKSTIRTMGAIIFLNN